MIDPALTGIDLPAAQSAASSAAYEPGIAHQYYLSSLPPGAPIRSLDEMLSKGADMVSPSLAQVATIRSLDRHPLFLAALRQQAMLRDALVDLMDRYELDAVVLPYRTVTASGVAEDLGGARGDTRNGLHAYTGLPAVLVPGGYFKEDGMAVLDAVHRASFFRAEAHRSRQRLRGGDAPSQGAARDSRLAWRSLRL
ncbi:MAG: hypothetical protein WDO56_19775 [Gammaproteobacteria bacterium]